MNKTLGLYGSARHTAVQYTLHFPNSQASKTFFEWKTCCFEILASLRLRSEHVLDEGTLKANKKLGYGHSIKLVTKFLENSGPVSFRMAKLFSKRDIAVRCSSLRFVPGPGGAPAM